MVKNLYRSVLQHSSRHVILIHVLCWVLFITYELTIVYFTLGALEEWYVYFVFYPINIAFFYLYVAILNHTVTGRPKQFFKGVCFYLLLLMFYLAVKSIADYFLSTQPRVGQHTFIYIRPYIPRNIVRAFNFTILGTFYWSAGRIAYFREQAIALENRRLITSKEKAELETQLTRTRNAYLQQQINPHLLFNALNFVYSKVMKYSDEAANCIWLLSEIMRFSLEKTGGEARIPVGQEAGQIQNLLAINNYRFNACTYIDIDFRGDLNSVSIIPLILLTLTENVFKHGDLTNPDYPARLSLDVDDTGKLVFLTSNLKKAGNDHPRRNMAMGLQNARTRLEAAYSKKYTLNISEPGNYYELTLILLP